MSRNQFTHLHTHSHYSLLDGLSKIPQLVANAKELGMEALALTDHGAMYGAIEFYKACKEADIKPVVGVEAYVAERTRFDKESGIDDKRYHLTLLAQNEKGYKNLLKLVSRAHLEGFYYKPRIDHDLLEEHAEGVICLTGCPSSKFNQLLRRNKKDEARDLLQFYIDTFEKENVFVEVMKHEEVEWYMPLIPTVRELADEAGLPIVATWDSHYLHKEDKEAHTTLLGINTQNKSPAMKGDYSFIDAKEAFEIYKDIPEAVENTQKVVERVNLELELGSWVFPKFDLPENKPADQVLRELAFAGFEERGIEQTPEYVQRLEYELGVIQQKGFSIYILIVADLLRYARKNQIFTTIRGSVAGSLTTYLTGITTVDPIHYKLPFERFLNPERPSAPDIDMDYADNRRDEMLDYAREKYGNDKVAQIGTFGTMAARGSVRDVARALGYPYATGDQIAKLIPIGSQGFPMTIERALEMEPDLLALYKNDDDAREVIDLAKRIEGSARHISVHAAGVVISPSTVTDYVPIQFDPKAGKTITQYDMHAVEDAGLIKFDFLGLKNLSILSNAVKITEKHRDVIIDIENIPLDDKNTLEMLARGETHSIFQLNGSGMTKFLKDLQPTRIEDINAMVALYRPGPMESIPMYIERKHNSKLISYVDPRLEPILKESYGVITYQDDVMMIAIELAGFSWLEADKLRKAMGKKIPAEMEKQKQKLLDGLEKNGMDKRKAQSLWALIEPFAAYGFNKAHAASYGRVAYQTAYMKANYPVEYMAAVLTADSGEVESIAEAINECSRIGIDVLPPDINESVDDFTVVHENGEDKIRFGLTSIKNFGTGITATIIEERKKNGPFTSLSNFLRRVQDRNINKKSLEALIKSGALDSFGERGTLLYNLDLMLAYAKEYRKDSGAQESLFAAFGETDQAEEIRLETTEPMSDRERLAAEKELLGLYVSGHPLNRFKKEMENKQTRVAHILEKGQEGQPVVLCGIVEDANVILTKKGEKMAFVSLADFTGSIELVVFSRVFREHQEMFEKEACICIQGKFSKRRGEPSIIVERVRYLKDSPQENSQAATSPIAALGE